MCTQIEQMFLSFIVTKRFVMLAIFIIDVEIISSSIFNQTIVSYHIVVASVLVIYCYDAFCVRMS